MTQEVRIQLVLAVQRPEARRSVEEIIRSMLDEAYQTGYREGKASWKRRLVTNYVNLMENSMGISAVHAAQTHCVHGHPLFGANLNTNKRGHRKCRTCKRGWDKKYWRRRKLRSLAV